MTGRLKQSVWRGAWQWFARWAEAMEVSEAEVLEGRIAALERKVEQLRQDKANP